MGALVVVLLAAGVGPAAAAAVEERRLREARAQLAQVREQVESLEQRRAQDAAALAELQARFDEVVATVEAAEEAVQRQTRAVAEARAELLRLDQEAARYQHALASRAVELYQRGTAVPFASVLAAATPKEAVRRSVYVEVLTRADRAALEQADSAQVALDAQRQRLELQEETLRRVLAEREALLAEVRELHEEHVVRLAAHEERLEQLQARERELESEREELAAQAQRAERENRAVQGSQRAARGERNTGGRDAAQDSGDQPSESRPRSAEDGSGEANGSHDVPANGDVWDRLAQCESDGNWHSNTGNGFYGGLQFSLASWRAVGGTGYPHEHPRETQIRKAQRLQAIQGWGAWPRCARALGLLG